MGYDIRTDMAVELQQIHQLDEIRGVKEEKFSENGININRVEILSDEASKKFNKEKGTYVTIEYDGAFSDYEMNNTAVEVICEEMKKLHDFNNKSVLIAGLGNSELTADALGPHTVSNIIITRHLKQHMPDLFKSLKLGQASAISPNVLGKTGIESAEIVKSCVEKTKPDIVILIDALAARDMKRLCSNVQMSNTGLNPGSGVGNNRDELSFKTLGVPVMSIGIPTVVHAATLVTDAFETFLDNFEDNDEKKSEHKEISYSSIKSALSPYDLNLIVTPKDIDILMQKCVILLSTAINKAIHNNIDVNEMKMLMS